MIKYAIAMQKPSGEEYLRQTHGDDCFVDDIGRAILYELIGEIPPLSDEDEYIVKVECDPYDGIQVVGKSFIGRYKKDGCDK